MHLLDFGAVTDRGTVRDSNEDNILAVPPVFVVADGIGGNAGGDVASSIVVDAFAEVAAASTIDPDAVGAAIQAAHTRIRALDSEGHNGPGSTAVGAVGVMSGDEPYWVVFNVGDSRIYQIPVAEPQSDQPRIAIQISVDHSHVQELVDADVITAEQAATHPDRNLVTRAVGAAEGCEPDFWMIPMVPGDRWLLCSDGLFGNLGSGEITDRLAAESPAPATAQDLLRMALEAGAPDNVSVIVVDVLPEESRPDVSPRHTDDPDRP